MRIVTINHKVFKFDELPEKLQEKIVFDYINFMLEVVEEPEGNFKKAIDKAEELRTPWFTASYVYDYCKDGILADLRDNEYFENGEEYHEEDYK